MRITRIYVELVDSVTSERADFPLLQGEKIAKIPRTPSFDFSIGAYAIACRLYSLTQQFGKKFTRPAMKGPLSFSGPHLQILVLCKRHRDLRVDVPFKAVISQNNKNNSAADIQRQCSNQCHPHGMPKCHLTMKQLQAVWPEVFLKDLLISKCGKLRQIQSVCHNSQICVAQTAAEEGT